MAKKKKNNGLIKTKRMGINLQKIQMRQKKIKKIRNVQIEEVTSATENVTFKIPSTLQ